MAVTKSRLGIVGVVVICVAVAAFFLLGAKAEFKVTSLEVSPSETFVGESVTVSANVKNVGNAEGTYKCILVIDGVEWNAKEVKLSEGEEKVVTFEVVEGTEGNYTIKVGDQATTLTVSPKLFVGAYSQEVLQAVIDEAAEELKHKDLINKVVILAYKDQEIELGFYGKIDSEVVEIVKAIIERRAPGVPLEVVENVTVITDSLFTS